MHTHTLLFNFLVYDWLASEYAECIENVQCALRTALRLRMVLLLVDTLTDPHYLLGTFVYTFQAQLYFKARLLLIFHSLEQIILHF